MRASRTVFDPPLPAPVFRYLLVVLLTQYPEVTVEEIDWALVVQDVQRGMFPRPGTLYVLEGKADSLA